MRDDTPTVYVLVGPAGPGKAAYADALVTRGVVRVDTPDGVVGHVAAGRDVLLEYATADADERDRCKTLTESHGAQWCLINFTDDHTPLAGRLADATDRGF
jgi:hypothetical protein